MLVMFCSVTIGCSGGSYRRCNRRPLLKFDHLCLFSNPFCCCCRMLKNKAQIARESIKTTTELPGTLSGPWTPVESEFGSALVICVRAHNHLRPPPPLNENSRSAPGLDLLSSKVYSTKYMYIFSIENILP